jgi:hypothetical protein
LDTSRGDFIEISSSSYNLSLFSSKSSSNHDGGVGAALRESSSMSIGDLWLEINSSRGADYEGAFMTATCGHLEILMSRPLSGAEGSKKRKIKANARDAAEDATLK